MNPFHLAIPVSDLEATKIFFCDVLGCTTGRITDRWIDFNFFGHQLTTHLVAESKVSLTSNAVDDTQVATPHFGVILEWDQWHKLAVRLRATNVEFLIQPIIRFEGKIGEHATLFVKDPSGYALEFKSFKDKSQIFASDSCSSYESRQT